MTCRREPLAVLFADLADSTALFKAYGDELARDIVLQCLGILGEVVKSSAGTVVERIGDELMCTFADAHSAALSAVQMQKRIEQERLRGRLSCDVDIRIGLHFGPVLLDKGGIFGDTVYTAKRMSALAKRQQILTTAETVGEMGPAWRALCPFVDRTTIKGRRELFEIHEIIWDESVHTLDVVTPHETSDRDSELHLIHCDKETVLGESQPFYTIGRNTKCNFAVHDKEVSRVHARIEFRKGKFILTDLSRNGTVVVDEHGKANYVHRDEFRLSGRGSLRFFVKNQQKEQHILRFRVGSNSEEGSKT